MYWFWRPVRHYLRVLVFAARKLAVIARPDPNQGGSVPVAVPRSHLRPEWASDLGIGLGIGSIEAPATTFPLGSGSFKTTIVPPCRITVDRVVDRYLNICHRRFSVMVVGLRYYSRPVKMRNGDFWTILSPGLAGPVRGRTAGVFDASPAEWRIWRWTIRCSFLNRRSVNERAMAGLSLAHRRGSPYGLALIDVHFRPKSTMRSGAVAGDPGAEVSGRAELSSTVRDVKRNIALGKK